jgi:hypothetical protein
MLQAARSRSHEVLVPLPCEASALKPPTDLRGTVLSASFQLVREHNLEAAYFRALPAELHDAVRFVVPLSWVPLDLARAHFRAMDRVFPDPRQQVLNGKLSSERTQSSWIKTLVRALVASGQAPTLGFIKRIPSAFERLQLNGGGVAVLSSGPKDARIELYAQPLVETSYIRHGWQGMFEAGISLASRSCVVRQDPRFLSVDRMAFDVSWV